MTNLNDLAARVEALTGPDREVDIAVALSQPERFFNAGPYYEGASDRIGQIEADGSHSIPGNYPDMLVPAYTASIDAAMMLVPEGWGWSLDSSGLAKTCPDHDGTGPLLEAYAATPALALTAAALRSRVQGEG